MMVNSTAQDEVDLSPNDITDVRGAVTALFKPKWPNRIPLDGEIDVTKAALRDFYRNAGHQRKGDTDWVTISHYEPRTDKKVIIDGHKLFSKITVRPKPKAEGKFIIKYTSKNIPGDFYLVPDGLPKGAQTHQFDASRDEKAWFGKKPWSHVSVVACRVAAMNENKWMERKSFPTLRDYLPGYGTDGKPALRRTLVHSRTRETKKKVTMFGDANANYAPQMLRLEVRGLPFNVQKVAFTLLKTSSHPGYCMNGIADAVNRDNGGDFSFFYSKSGPVPGFIVTDRNTKPKKDASDNLYKGQIEFSATSEPRAWVYLYCKDYAAQADFEIQAWTSGDKSAIKNKFRIPVDDDDDKIADRWEVEQVVAWHKQYNTGGGAVAAQKLPERELAEKWLKGEVLSADDTKKLLVLCQD